MQEANLVLRQVVVSAHQGKLQHSWKGSYHIYHKLPHIAYKLEELDERLIPRT